MNKMNKDELFDVFKTMFPNWVPFVRRYKKISSRALAITFRDTNVDDQFISERSRVFLYIDDTNWHFGTKLWRRMPKKLENRRSKNNISEKVGD